MNATKLIYSTLSNKSINIKTNNDLKTINYCFEAGKEKGNCYLCNSYTEKGFFVKKVIKPTFTNSDLAKDKNSNVICEACSFCLSKQELRSYGLFVTSNSFIHPTLKEFKKIILTNKVSPFVMHIPTSGKKWILLKSDVNYNTEHFTVMLEEEKIFVDRKQFSFLIEQIEKLYNLKTDFTKKEIASFNFDTTKILKFGTENFYKIYSKIEKFKNTKLLKLCCHLAQKEEV